MAKAKKLPSGKWRCRPYDYTDEKGKRHYVSFTANTRKEAEYLAAEFSLKKKDIEIVTKRTYAECLDEYIENRSAVLSPSTIREYKRSRRCDMQNLMGTKVCDITREQIQQAINLESKVHSPKSVRNMHGLLSAVLKAYRPDFALNTALPKRIRPNICVPTDEQVKTLMAYVEGTEMEIPILLAAFGPMRRSEICALDSNHVSGQTIHVEFAIVLDEHNKWVKKSTKSYAGDRMILFPDFVINKLKNAKGQIVSLNPAQISDRFIDILKRAGISHFRFHDLRHYNASISHALGIPDQYIMARGGWASDNTLKNVYRHTMSDRTEQMNQTANSHFENLCTTKCTT